MVTYLVNNFKAVKQGKMLLVKFNKTEVFEVLGTACFQSPNIC